MSKNEFKGKTSEQLTKEISDMREKLRVIRFGGAGSRSRNVKESRGVRKDIARALTELKSHDIAVSGKKA
ncbi:MAG TPA: 50S ribosomal protein L29 [Candidatus Paceibacterota bacterium]|nr:50S ribosomal protein L29 [Candidatus Paceibacterota bacterium]